MLCTSYIPSRKGVADGSAPQTEQPGGGAFTGTTKFVSSVYFTRIFSHILCQDWVQVFRVRVLNLRLGFWVFDAVPSGFFR